MVVGNEVKMQNWCIFDGSCIIKTRHFLFSVDWVGIKGVGAVLDFCPGPQNYYECLSVGLSF